MTTIVNKVSKEEKDTITLLYEYKKNRTVSLKNQIVKLNLLQVKKIAKAYSNNNLDTYDDLIQVGCLGLLSAIERFDMNQNASFKTYSTHLITGEIKHYLRDHNSLVKLPRDIQEIQPKVNRAKQQISFDKNMDPSIKEISDFLNIPVEKVSEVFEMESSTNFLSFEQKVKTSMEDSNTYSEIIEDKKLYLITGDKK